MLGAKVRNRRASLLESSLFNPRHSLAPASIFVLALCAGCFSERSFTYDPQDVIPVGYKEDHPPRNVREWTRRAHVELAHLLPYDERRLRPLVTEQLTDASGKPVDVFAHFRKIKSMLHTLIGNLSGISHTAQVTGSTNATINPAPPWDGFDDIWVPINDTLSLSARVGWAREGGRIVEADCIILLPGLLGDNMRKRARDIGAFFTDAGYHVLSLEFRGHGQTHARYPDIPYNYGTLEAGDLIAVARWVEALPHVRETGVVAFSWNANVALLAVWENGRDDDHPSVSPRLKPFLHPRGDQLYFKAGVFCISPVLDFETNTVDALDHQWPILKNPVLNAVQNTVNWRARLRGYDDVDGSLRRLIHRELVDSGFDYDGFMDDGFDYLRFLPYKGRPSGRKLESARVPVLILHASDDPLAYAQEVADVFAETKNPNVAGIILKGGGHDGFAAYCKDYFYSLMLNFFDTKTGVRHAHPRRSMAEGLPEPTTPPVLSERGR